MSKQIVNTSKAPAAIGPYSQAWISGDMLITSGQLGIDPATGALPATVGEQTEQSLKNVGAILEEAGFEKTDVIKTTVFLKNMGDFAEVNRIYAEFFGEHKPARSCVAVAQLPKDGLVEIEVTAVRG